MTDAYKPLPYALDLEVLTADLAAERAVELEKSVSVAAIVPTDSTAIVPPFNDLLALVQVDGEWFGVRRRLPSMGVGPLVLDSDVGAEWVAWLTAQGEDAEGFEWAAYGWHAHCLAMALQPLKLVTLNVWHSPEDLRSYSVSVPRHLRERS